MFLSPCLEHIPWQCKKKQKHQVNPEFTEAQGAKCCNRNSWETSSPLCSPLFLWSWESPLQNLLRTPGTSCWKCPPQAKSEWADQIKEKYIGKPEGGKFCPLGISGSILRTFHFALPAAPINSHSNQPTVFFPAGPQGRHACCRKTHTRVWPNLITAEWLKHSILPPSLP